MRIFKLLIISLAVVSMVGCRDHSSTPGKKSAVNVIAATVTRANIPIYLSRFGSLDVDRGTMIKPLVAGIVSDVYVANGAYVKKGQPLFQLDDQKDRADLNKAQSDLKLAEMNYKRDKPLVASGAISKQQWDQFKSQLASAKATVAGLQALLGYKRITAPYSGRVEKRLVNVGSYVDAGTALIQITEIKTVKVDYEVPETQLTQVKIHQPITLTTPALPQQTFHGKVTFVATQIDPATRQFSVEAHVPNPKDTLLPGMFVTIKQLIKAHNLQTVVPATAVQSDLLGHYVFVIKDAKAVRHSVSVKPIPHDQRMIVLKGLQPGMRVVSGNAASVREGAALHVVH